MKRDIENIDPIEDKKEIVFLMSERWLSLLHCNKNWNADIYAKN